MSTILLVVIVVAVAGGITYFLMKKGKIADANNNNIPDAIEEKVEEVKVVVKKAKAKVEPFGEKMSCLAWKPSFAATIIPSATVDEASTAPSAIFPAIIFPGIFIDVNGGMDLENNPKILASIIAVTVGIFSKNITATIFAGLIAYWYIIFI